MIYTARCASPVQPDSHLQINHPSSQLIDGLYHGTVSFDCDPGYILMGNNSSSCHYSGWIPQPPKCIGKMNTIILM